MEIIKQLLKAIVTTILIVMVASLIILLARSMINKDVKTIPNSIQVIKVDHTEEILVRWVYSHSERISHATAQEIVQECLKTRYPLVMLGLIEMESGFIPTAVSKVGALGLTQVMFNHHGEALSKAGIIKERRDLFDVTMSVRSGAYVLELYLKQSKGDLSGALEMYLGGKDGVYLKRILLNVSNIYILIQDGKNG